MLLSSFASGAGYLPASPDLADRNLFLGGMADRARRGHRVLQRGRDHCPEEGLAFGRALQRGRHLDSGLDGPQELGAQGLRGRPWLGSWRGAGEGCIGSRQLQGRAPQQRHPPLAQRPRQPPVPRGQNRQRTALPGPHAERQPARPDRQRGRHAGRRFCRTRSCQSHAQRRQPMRGQFAKPSTRLTDDA